MEEIISSISASMQEFETKQEVKSENIENIDSYQMTVFSYIIGLIIILLINAAPYAYYKYVKNKKVFSRSNTSLDSKSPIT